ncbi:PREDICTED: G-protein coupled receptor Mth2 isoform X1 [Rhagoletis zephyria]|uniref:G-protein coupled receptor Mth2 isoform X1 n=1 Tax=Rhagoletis zephyria TaxID=28612 RepID=UPI0008113A1D|nr:PREDICTED: G-protein coupled receptor Mth2 isoform X1 [Rhagoletis zephyria]
MSQLYTQSQVHRFPLLVVLICSTIALCIPPLASAYNEELHQRDGIHVPCTFFDTVNVTGDLRFANGSYLHDGVLIPSQLVGWYDYIYTDLVRRVEVEPHARACICKLKPCINICCPWGASYSTNESACVNNTDYEWPQPLLNLTLPDETLRSVDMFKQFAVQSFRPCEFMYSLQPELGSFDDWKLFENGTLLRVDDMVYLSKNEFCFHPTVANYTDTMYIINPANCNYDTDFSTIKTINAYAMLFSIPFMILTIVVYLSIPELRNQHGKSLVCYLIGLIIGYSLLAMSSLRMDYYSSIAFCKTLGYVAYYFFMAAFFWLSVISFDLWHNFRGTRGINRFQEKKRYLIYSLYAWGIPVPFLVFTWYAQEVADIPDYLKPGIGGGEFCWLDMRTWSAMIYFFGPIVLIIMANSIMFVLTAMKIHKVQREMARIMAREDSTKNLRTEKDKFGLFLRLFIVMGVTWSMEILSYFVGADKGWAKIFYISDICNAIQGFLIFMLFVMKKKVKHLITNRYSSTRDSSNQRQSQYSTKTTSSSVGNLTLSAAGPAERPLMLPTERTTSLRN